MKKLEILPIEESTYNKIIESAKDYYVCDIDNMKQKRFCIDGWSYWINEPNSSSEPVYISNLVYDNIDSYDLEMISSSINKEINIQMSDFREARSEYLEQCQEEAEALAEMEVW